MKITVSITERVNLGNYEFVEHTASVEFNDADITGDPDRFASDQIDVLLRCHRRRALRMLPEDSESFLNYHPAVQEK